MKKRSGFSALWGGIALVLLYLGIPLPEHQGDGYAVDRPRPIYPDPYLEREFQKHQIV